MKRELREIPGFDHKVGRRVFIKGLGWIGSGLLFATLGGCECLIESIKNRPVRRRLRTGSAEVDAAIATYKQAVTAMKALSSSDPRSWSAQAGLHGTASAFNFCQHGTDHFFSWHRAYLLYFERICQKLTGNKDFGLPYWNWNQDSTMHSAFTDSTSSLFHTRSGTSVAGYAAFSNATLNTIFSDTNFFTFGSQIEGTPHNSVHNIVNGDMATGASPLDPIFWAHHCMVDYCWAKWNIELENDNTNDSAWTGTSWDHFVDDDGDPVSVTAGVTTLMPLLSYQYESSAIGSSSARMMLAKEDFKKIEKRIRKGADIKFDIKRRVSIANRAGVRIEKPFSTETTLNAGDFSALIKSDSAKERIFASVAYAKLPPTTDFFVRLFVNLPAANKDTPIEDPHYAGTFAFFGTDSGEHHHQGRRFLVNVTPTLQRLTSRGELRDRSRISLQLVAVPIGKQFARPDAELQLEKVELIITPIIVKSR
jgi:tyrosinase